MMSVRDLQRARVVVTGHSLGGAIATVTTPDLAHYLQNITEHSKYRAVKVTLVALGAPRAGNVRFARNVAQAVDGRAFRVVNHMDIVTAGPPAFLDFAHVPGRTLTLSRRPQHTKWCVFGNVHLCCRGVWQCASLLHTHS